MTLLSYPAERRLHKIGDFEMRLRNKQTRTLTHDLQKWLNRSFLRSQVSCLVIYLNDNLVNLVYLAKSDLSLGGQYISISKIKDKYKYFLRRKVWGHQSVSG